MANTGATDRGLPELPCICASLRRAARAVSRVYEAELRSSPLTGPQLTLLQVLARIRLDPGRDRRERHLHLTPEGKRQLERAIPAWERAQQRLKTTMGGDRWRALLAELSSLAGEAARA